MKKKALLLEDEPALASSLKVALKKLGFEVSGAENLKEARLLMAKSTDWELLVLDRNLPDGDGIDFCRESRGFGFSGAIIVLTARGDVGARVEGLEAGADDYLPKPFSWEEFSARIKAITRRSFGPESAKPVELGPWTLNENDLSVKTLYARVILTKLEFQMARKLISSEGKAITREELLKDVWGYQWLPETRTVDFFIGRLRKKFEKSPERPEHFLTVRGVGYRFVP